MKIINSVLSFACLLSLLVSCNENAQRNVDYTSVKIDTVRPNGDKSLLQYPGRVVASQDIDLSFRVSGKIQSIRVKEGDAVKAGQLLAVMDPTDYQIQLAGTKAKYMQVKAEADRVKALYKDGGTTPNDYDKAVYGLQQIEALYQHHKDELSYTRLYAPFDGYIQKSYFNSYEMVAAGMPVLSLFSSNAPEVEINLPAAEYIRRSNFSGYHCTFDLYPGKVYPLTLISITHKANSNQLYTMRLKLNADGQPLPSAGMNTMVSISCNDGERATMLVPSSALLSNKGRSSVFVYNPKTKKVKNCEVKCLRPLSNGTTVITSSKVKAGDIIVSAGVHAIKDGAKVRPLTPVSKTNIGGLL